MVLCSYLCKAADSPLYLQEWYEAVSVSQSEEGCFAIPVGSLDGKPVNLVAWSPFFPI